MQTIRFTSRLSTQYVLIPSRFLEQYMPGANGEFVKVYLCLLQMAQAGEETLCPEKLADRLFLTEKDVMRALKYWQGEGLLTFTAASDGVVTELVLLEPPARETVAPEIVVADEDNSVHGTPAKRLSPERVKALQADPVMMELLFLTEKYLGKTLSSNDVNRICFFYDELHMTPDLIEYLIEYCVTHNHRSMRYIETVALAWTEEGITTVQEARQVSSRYSKEYYSVLKALGITNRSPVQEEISYIDTWTGKYGFDFSIICEACSRTVMKTGQGNFAYTDRILSDWKTQNVHTLEDIRRIDAEYQKQREKNEARGRSAARTEKRPNRFNNFHQRDYDYDEVEKQLLNGQTASE